MKLLLSIAAMLVFIGQAVAQQLPVSCTELFFSEMVEGTGKNRAVEVYNPSDAFVDLSDYSIKVFTNGPQNPNVLQMSGFLGPKQTHTCGHNQAPPGTIILCDITSSELKFDGDDAIGLFKNDTLIDMIGVVGQNPGVLGWQVGTGYTKNFTLRRNKNTVAPTTFWNISVLQWDVEPIDDVAGLGDNDNICADPTIEFVLTSSNHNEGDGTGDIQVRITGNAQLVGPVLVPIVMGSPTCDIITPPPPLDPDADCPDDFELVPFLGSNNCGSWIQSFAAGVDAFYTMELQLVDDILIEQTETYCLLLTDPAQAGVQYNLGTNITHRIIIEDNEPPLGVAENGVDKIKIYPTATRDKVNILGLKLEGLTVRALNLNGQAVQLPITQSGSKIVADVSGLAEGFYMIQASSAYGVFTQKVVKLRR